MADKKTGVAAKVRELVSQAIVDAGYRVWDVDYYKEGPEMILEISIDSDNGVSINDCAIVTKIVEPMIDEPDPIEESYCLQVSSAGTVRPLGRDEHIRFALESGLPVTVTLYKAEDGKKEFSGRIVAYDGETLTMECEYGSRSFTKKQTAKITADFNYNENEVSGGPETDDKEQ